MRKLAASIVALPALFNLMDKTDVSDMSILFTDLKSIILEPSRPFDGVAPGEFYDMWGRKTIIKKSDLKDYVDNTQNAINYTKTESGDVVGLPIDAFNHDNGDGAGWIIAASLESVEKPDGKKIDVIRFVARWTEIGRDLIEKGIRRMFSPTLDTEAKVILGGSLTNWPATRDKVGNVLLRPIELTAGFYYLSHRGGDDNGNGVLNMEKEELLALFTGVMDEKLTPITTKMAELESKFAVVPVAPVDAPVDHVNDIFALLEMEDQKGQVSEAVRQALLSQFGEMKARAGRDAAEFVAQIQHEDRVKQFVALAIGGDKDKPRGLPVQVKELEKFCLSLNKDQYKFFSGLVGSIQQSGMTEFEELGSAGKPKGTKQLPADIVSDLRSGELKLQDLSNPILAPVIGELDEYDLSEFRK